MHLPQHESSEYRYCTNFAVTGSGLDAREFIPRLEQIGDCVLVVGDQATLKVHVHTDEPDLATSIFVARGEVSHFDVADMHEQVADRDAPGSRSSARRWWSQRARGSCGCSASSARTSWRAGRR